MKIPSILLLALCAAPLCAQPPQIALPDLEALFLQQFDTDGDGSVTRDEFMRPTLEQFDHMDSNGDGTLDTQEIRTFNAELARRMLEMRKQMPPSAQRP